MDILHFQHLVKEDFDAVNNLLITNFKSTVPLIDDIVDHIMHSGGKRIRPLLTLLAANACQYQGKQHIKLAAMIEYFHTATLLHDDVVDESELRRGKQTANKIWGNKASVLAGDILFTKHMELMVDVGNTEIIQLLISVAPQMGHSEIKDLSHRHNISLMMGNSLEKATEMYFEVVHGKTALLFAAAATIGAIISKACESIRQDLYHYGLHLGTAFQLYDDILDYSSDSAILGKPVGNDLCQGKLTLPLLYTLKKCTKAQRLIIQKSMEEGSLAYLPEILTAMAETKAIEHTKAIAMEKVELAIAALEHLDESVYKTGLSDLAYFAAQRDY